MSSHAPAGYACPFCRPEGHEIVHRDAHVLVKVNPRWAARTPGALLVIPVAHHEDLYGLPDHLAVPLHRAVRESARALKAAFGCDGVSTRQHNEPAGNQTVWHYHVHVVPRWEGDGFYAAEQELADPDEVRRRGECLRAVWPEIWTEDLG
jgi:histidine triad (HIT) family protein